MPADDPNIKGVGKVGVDKVSVTGTVADLKHAVISANVDIKDVPPRLLTVYAGDGTGTWHKVEAYDSLRTDTSRREQKEYRVGYPQQKPAKSTVCTCGEDTAPLCSLNRQQLRDQRLMGEAECKRGRGVYHCKMCEKNAEDHAKTPTNDVTEAFGRLSVGSDTVYFPDASEFKGVPPIGKGVRGCTALPMMNIHERILRRRKGVVWVEAPPLSGKTSLGQILKFCHGFTCVCCDGKIEAVTESLKTDRHHLFVDEAQRLSIPELARLRELATDRLIVCAGVSGVPAQPCREEACRDKVGSDCNFVCQKCREPRCHSSSACHHEWFNSTSLILLDPDDDRIHVDEFVVDRAELVRFLQAIRKTPWNMEVTALERGDADTISDAVLAFTGGVVGYTMAVISVVLHNKNKLFESKFEVQVFLKSMYSNVTFTQLDSDRLPDCEVEMRQPIVEFLRDHKQPEKRIGELMRKRGWVRFNDHRYERSSPFVFELMYRHFFLNRAEHHKTATPFTTLSTTITMDPSKGIQDVKTVGAIESVLQRMRRDHVVDTAGGMLHEDEINGTIAYFLKDSLTANEVHMGPAKRTKGDTYAQVDHELSGTVFGGAMLIEVCCRDIRKHCDRFTTGVYSTVYHFNCAVVLNFSTTSGDGSHITSFSLSDARCHFVQVYVRTNGFEVAIPNDRGDPSRGCCIVARIPFSGT
jgi:hypothetical protein